MGAGVLAVVLLLFSATSPMSGFNCNTTTCPCAELEPGFYAMECSKYYLELKMKLQKSAIITCLFFDTLTPIRSEIRFPVMPNLEIGNLQELTLTCPLPDMSYKQIMSSMGITHIKYLRIIVPFHFEHIHTLTKKHFENLSELTNLHLEGYRFLLSENVFEGMTNLTRLKIKIHYSQFGFPKTLFSFTSKLEVLELHWASPNNLDPTIFHNLTQLRHLTIPLSNNFNKTIFSDLLGLETLVLYMYKNTSEINNWIEPDLFVDLVKLKTLIITHMYDFDGPPSIILPTSLLSSNTQLREFRMVSNGDTYVSIADGTFSKLLNLKMVTVNNCRLSLLPENVFQGSGSIEKLNLSKNNLETLNEETFMDLKAVELIDLSYNHLTILPEGLFSKTLNLRTLLLLHNEITRIYNGLFVGLTSLEYLDLSHNELKKIEEDQFLNLKSLKTLNISRNLLTSLLNVTNRFHNTSVLQACTNLEDLQLKENELTSGYDDWRHFKHLKVLNLADNNIMEEIDLNMLNFNSEVTIDLTNNYIKTVNLYGYLFYNVNSKPERDRSIRTKTLIIDRNMLRCDCKNRDFILLVQGKIWSANHYLRVSSRSYKLICYDQNELTRIIDHFDISQLNCSYCLKQCTCYFDHTTKSYYVKCEKTGFTEMPDDLKLFKGGSNHSELHLKGNYLHSTKVPDNEAYQNVTHYYLANNRITKVDVSHFSPNLKVLDLSYNIMTSLSDDAISFLRTSPKLSELSLHGNSWQCDCEVMPLVDLIKELSGKVLHPNNITCAGSKTPLVTLSKFKVCPGMIIMLIIAIAMMMIVILVLNVVYYKYKTEIRIYCYSSQWRFVRWMVSHPDLDENKIYDAFISYANEDEEFVVNHLVPELEENGDMRFKLCLHFRDWIGGEMIQTQIFNSVKQSRRTIVVLSPKYLESVWGKVEFKVAHAEALKERTTKVIVILYQDVGDVEELDDELKAYLRMNTYVRWGSPWFWQQLKYALPHPPRKSDGIKRRHRTENISLQLQTNDCNRPSSQSVESESNGHSL